jgi:hypothetical protein
MHEKLVRLLYILMRDEVTPGRIESLIQDHCEAKNPVRDYSKVAFSNAHLEAYARELADRLTSVDMGENRLSPNDKDLFVKVEIFRADDTKLLQMVGRATGPLGWAAHPDGEIYSPGGFLRNFLFKPNVSEQEWEREIG